MIFPYQYRSIIIGQPSSFLPLALADARCLAVLPKPRADCSGQNPMQIGRGMGGVVYFHGLLFNLRQQDKPDYWSLSLQRVEVAVVAVKVMRFESASKEVNYF